MPDTRRLAVVGGGPRALFALDCLAGAAAAHTQTQLAVTIYEPSAWPGAGPVYAPDQPDYLLMNFTAGLVDAWDRSYAHNEYRPRLLDWLEEHYPDEANPAAYVPRARVGEYLHACFNVLTANLAPNMSLHVERDFVARVQRIGERWRVESASQSAFFDDVLLATGHQRWQREDAPLTSYPVARLQALAAPKNRALICKGFGLTFIDTALARVWAAAADSSPVPMACSPTARAGRNPMPYSPSAGRAGRCCPNRMPA